MLGGRGVKKWGSSLMPWLTDQDSLGPKGFTVKKTGLWVTFIFIVYCVQVFLSPYQENVNEKDIFQSHLINRYICILVIFSLEKQQIHLFD